ncbi:phosphotransferase family protein [Fredinandcohnia humi]
MVYKISKEMDTFINENLGEIVKYEKVTGIKEMGGCFRVTLSHNESLIVKGDPSCLESIFYREIAPNLREKGVNIPHLIHTSFEESLNHYWTIMECVPYSLPRDRWFADQDIINTLVNLHNATWQRTFEIPGSYKPVWHEKMNAKIVSMLDNVNESRDLELQLNKLMQDSSELFLPYCNINGDTNPTNWGIRENNEIVLFDWERFSNGSPAIDLAISIPGIGSLDNQLELEIATKYLASWRKLDTHLFPYSEKELVHEINKAKIWVTIEFISNQVDGFNSEVVTWFLEKLPLKIKAMTK